MKLFIVLVLGFLTLGFYELSGGADFDPVAARDAAVLDRLQEMSDNAPGPVTVAELPAKPVPAPALARQQDDGVTVTRAALNLTSFEDVVTEAVPATAAVIAPAEQKLNTASAEASVTPVVARGISLEAPEITADGDGTVPSLIFPGNTSASTDVSATPDVRTVAGDLVNVRGGPGTSYKVVNQLKRDAMVEIIAENGAGWVQLRPVDGSPAGWMADFLLND
ncbi:SH3 domain-containing protein [uncultured Roseobacter sp.]|uniref:SH3 domain-containing protein n=1 Tax=uncultured Roseobacter sp. TaxID=114847 RepID=UPI002619A50B|nr:SH3 domain-containing protein [uncultured Roseobacter sp.]